jgi:hypothetical protein
MAQRRIDDHNSWIGKGNDIEPLPTETKIKKLPEIEGAGHLMNYPDTIEEITEDMRESVRKVHGYPTKKGYRN